MLFDANNHAFRVLGRLRGGAFTTTCDLPSTRSAAASSASQRELVSRGQPLRYEAEFCNRAYGWEKWQIEKNDQDARHRLWQPMHSYLSLSGAKRLAEERAAEELCAQTLHGSQASTNADAWAEEARHLMPLPRSFDGFVEYAKRVSQTSLIHLERNRYSVPASFANRPVSVRDYPERIDVAAEGQGICDIGAYLFVLIKKEYDERLRLAALYGGH